MTRFHRPAVVAVALSAALAGGCATPAAAPVAPTALPATATAAAASPSARVSSSTSALPDQVDIEAAGALTIEATSSIDWIVLLEDHAWVMGFGDGMGVLDASGKLQKSIAVAGWCESLDVGFGAVWSASCQPAGIIRIDAETMVVQRAEFDVPIVDSEASVGAGEGAVWLVVGDRSDVLLEIDPETLMIEHRHPIPAGGAGVRAGLGGVWITMPSADQVLRVDPSTGAIVASIAVGRGPRFLALGEGSVWVMNQVDGSVSRIDPKTDQVAATIDVGEEIHGGDIAVGGGSVWVHGGPEMLARIDPALDLVTERYSPNEGSGGVAADDDAVWVTEHDIATIWRLPLR